MNCSIVFDLTLHLHHFNLPFDSVVRSGKVSPPRVASLRSVSWSVLSVCLSLVRFLRFVCRLPDHEIIASIFIASIRPSNRPIVDNERARYFQQTEIPHSTITFEYSLINREKKKRKKIVRENRWYQCRPLSIARDHRKD